MTDNTLYDQYFLITHLYMMIARYLLRNLRNLILFNQYCYRLLCQKETLLMTYKAVGRSIINYAAPVWSPNLHDTNYRKIQYTQNEAPMIATGCHKMSSVDHLHTEAEMLKVKEHSELLSAQYLARCLEPRNVCHPITTWATPERQMKETLYTRHRNTVEPMMVKNYRKLHSKHSTLLQSLKLFSVTRGIWC